MQAGLTEAATPFLEERGWAGEPHRFVTWWRRTHFEDSMIDALCDRGHTPYREIGVRAVSQVMRRAGIEFSREDAEWLVARIVELHPFPDVVEALGRLAETYRLVILSNGDADMLEAATPFIGFEFDLVLSVEAAGYFKPHRATYAMAEAQIGEEPDRIMHVANHAFDCIGAKAYGMRAAFIDRRKRPYGDSVHQPDLIVGDLAELADVLVS